MQVLVSSLRTRGPMSARQLATDVGVSLSTARRWLYQAAATGDVVPVGLEALRPGKGRPGCLYRLVACQQRAASGPRGGSGVEQPVCGGIALRALTTRTPLEIFWSGR